MVLPSLLAALVCSRQRRSQQSRGTGHRSCGSDGAKTRQPRCARGDASTWSVGQSQRGVNRARFPVTRVYSETAREIVAERNTREFLRFLKQSSRAETISCKCSGEPCPSTMVSTNQPSEPIREIRSALGDQISGHYPSRPDAPSTRITRKVMIGSSIALTGPSSPIGAVLTWSGSANRSARRCASSASGRTGGDPFQGSATHKRNC